MSKLDIENIIDSLKITIDEQRIKCTPTNTSPWKTPCIININNAKINIQTASNGILIASLAEFITKFNSLNEAAKLLNLPTTDIIDGFLMTDWLHDFSKRVGINNTKEAQSKLDVLTKRLASITSEERKRELEAIEIAKELGITL